MVLVNLFNRLAAILDIPGFPWKRLLQSMIVADALFNAWLRHRQIRKLDTPYDDLTDATKKLVDKKTFTDGKHYQVSKLKNETVEKLANAAVDSLVIQSNLLPNIFLWAEKLSFIPANSKILQIIVPGIALTIFKELLQSMVQIPSSYYKTFYIEDKFNFNKMSLSSFIRDRLKTLLLGLTFSTIFNSILYLVISRYGRAFVAYGIVTVISIQILLLYLSPKIIIPLFYKMQELSDPELRESIEGLAKQLNFPLQSLYELNYSSQSSHSNAFFTGVPYCTQNIVLYDNLIKTSTKREVLAVIAHEMGHWSLHHITIQLIVDIALMAFDFSTLAVLLRSHSLGVSLGFPGKIPDIACFFVYEKLLWPLFLPLRFGLFKLSRDAEYAADRFSTELGYGTELISSLIEMHRKDLGVVIADPIYSAWNFSHPILGERLISIEELLKRQDLGLQ